MAEGAPDSPEQEPALSERVSAYTREVQSLIKQGIEHPQFEFKRSCSISRENLDDRLDFVKLAQGVANADIAGERFVIIGGDPKEKRFHSVLNSAEFDVANVTNIFAKYLNPPPRFQVFNNLETDDGHRFVLFVFDADQPKPIVVTTEGKRTDGKTRLQVGDIWVKVGTALRLATRSDLDSMYRMQMEIEAEDRARKRFRHFTDLAEPPHPPNPLARRFPGHELLFAPMPDFRRFVEELLVQNDYPRFRLFLEIARETLAESWDSLRARGSGLSPNADKYAAGVDDLFQNSFLPAVQSVVALGLLIVKYDFEENWLELVANTLLEAFEASRGLLILNSGFVIRKPEALQWWRPAFEIYVALRCLSAFAIRRNRLRFLASMLPRFVARITADNQRSLKTPVMFWPLSGDLFQSGELSEGRIPFYWKQRVSSSWGSFFGVYENFLGSACELEFLLEFNSYLGTNALSNASIQQWLEVNSKDLSFVYNPDLFAYDLHWTVPMAERCYDFVASDKPFPTNLAVEPKLFELVFSGKSRDQRLLIYGGFLYHLKSWQSETMMQSFGRFPFMYDWQGRLKEIVQKFKSQLPKKM